MNDEQTSGVSEATGRLPAEVRTTRCRGGREELPLPPSCGPLSSLGSMNEQLETYYKADTGIMCCAKCTPTTGFLTQWCIQFSLSRLFFCFIR